MIGPDLKKAGQKEMATIFYHKDAPDRPMGAVTEEGDALIPMHAVESPAGITLMLLFGSAGKPLWIVNDVLFCSTNDLAEIYPHMAEQLAKIRREIERANAELPFEEEEGG